MGKTFCTVLNPSLQEDRRRIYISYILQILGTASAVTLALALRPLPAWKIAKRFFQFHKLERQKLKRAIGRLEKRGLVKRQKRDDGNEYLLLTQAGEQEFMHEKKRALVLQKPRAWDKIWRIVVFDIIEDKKTVRDAMRRHLKKLGFYRLQKSVFVTPFPCEEEIKFLQKFYESEGEICLICAISLGEKEKSIRKYFGL